MSLRAAPPPPPLPPPLAAPSTRRSAAPESRSEFHPSQSAEIALAALPNPNPHAPHRIVSASPASHSVAFGLRPQATARPSAGIVLRPLSQRIVPSTAPAIVATTACKSRLAHNPFE